MPWETGGCELGFWDTWPACGLGEGGRLGPAQGVEPDKLLVETRLRLLLFLWPVGGAWAPLRKGIWLGAQEGGEKEKEITNGMGGREIGSGAPVGAGIAKAA